MNDLSLGILYVVATPIGNLGDVGERAVEILRQVDIIAAEDTRHSTRLLRRLGLTTPMLSLHEHNESRAVPGLIDRLERGEKVALISDAGTPLLSDPGFQLVRAVRNAGIRVSPIPGPSSITAALSAAGLPTDHFVFEGFLPGKAAARRRRPRELAAEGRTLVFFEAPHRVLPSLADMGDILGGDRPAVVARELTKLFEEIHDDTLGNLGSWLEDKPGRLKGEFVIMVQGGPEPDDELTPEDEGVLRLLLEELPVKKAASLAAKIGGKKKNAMYRRALQIMEKV